MNPSTWIHRIERVNGVRIHCVEAGTGPLVLLVHGFPESWYSYRHQLDALAAAGYRAVAIDVRGYGRSSKPTPIEAYRMLMHVRDNVELVHALGESQAVVVGHDWGAPIAWNSALLRPDVFRAVAGLSVPYSAPGERRPSHVFRAMGGDEEFYIEYFQQPGRAEAEIEADVRRWLLGFYFSASGDAPPRGSLTGTMASVPHGHQLIERFSYPDEMPAWLTADDLDVYVGEFERSGFTGGLNRYRNVDRDWEDLSAFRGRPIEVPALFIGGDRDGPTIWGATSIDRFPETLPRLTKSVVLPGCGHWTQQERADDVNALLVEFLAAAAD
ncbi:MAG: alpha/beta fold hydrolase [Ilumatobacteraceae bacterium]